MANKETSIFERRWTEADGREWADQLVRKEIHPGSVNVGLGMGCGTTWLQAVIDRLIELAQKGQRSQKLQA